MVVDGLRVLGIASLVACAARGPELPAPAWTPVEVARSAPDPPTPTRGDIVVLPYDLGPPSTLGLSPMAQGRAAPAERLRLSWRVGALAVERPSLPEGWVDLLVVEADRGRGGWDVVTFHDDGTLDAQRCGWDVLPLRMAWELPDEGVPCEQAVPPPMWEGNRAIPVFPGMAHGARIAWSRVPVDGPGGGTTAPDGRPVDAPSDGYVLDLPGEPRVLGRIVGDAFVVADDVPAATWDWWTVDAGPDHRGTVEVVGGQRLVLGEDVVAERGRTLHLVPRDQDRLRPLDVAVWRIPWAQPTVWVEITSAGEAFDTVVLGTHAPRAVFDATLIVRDGERTAATLPFRVEPGHGKVTLGLPPQPAGRRRTLEVPGFFPPTPVVRPVE